MLAQSDPTVVNKKIIANKIAWFKFHFIEKIVILVPECGAVKN
jgi:hypothetical protein